MYDVAIIGSGPGGYVAAIRCSQLGMKTVCVDSRDLPGRTCLNVGCIPSKALLSSTEHIAFLKNHAEEHGIQISGYNIDFAKMMSRKEAVVHGLTTSVAALFRGYHVDWIQGTASFEDTNKLKVNETIVEAKNIIIATGSESIALPFMPFDEKFIFSSTGILSLSEIPKNLIVIGAGSIGLEIASVYNRLGSKVTVIEMLDQISPMMDLTMTKMYLQVLRKQGLEFYLSAKVTEKSGNTIKVLHENEEKTFSADAILVAVGRRPYTERLNLEKVGIKTNEKGFIPVNEYFQTVVPHVFAIGDVIEGVMLAHKASAEGVAVAEILAGQSPTLQYITIPNVIYTHPELASVGYTEQEATQRGLKILKGISYFKGNPRARCSGEMDGCVKVIGEAQSNRLIGMHILGSHASELIAEGMTALEKKATLKDLAYSSNAHPTESEAIKEAALQAIGQPIHG